MRWRAFGLATYAIALGLVLFLPVKFAGPLVWPFAHLNFAAVYLLGVVAFIPIGFALARLVGRRWLAILIGIVLSVAIEAIQYFLLPDHDATSQDALTTLIGLAIGALLHRPPRHSSERRPRSRQSHRHWRLPWRRRRRRRRYKW